MSVQAAFVVLRNLLRRQKEGALLSNDHRPFGCAPDTLREILESGSRYTGTSHQDVMEVLKARPDLTQRNKSTDGRFLHHVQIGGGYVNVDPQSPQKGLSKGRELMKQHGRSFAAIVTGAAQSICVFFPAGSSQQVFSVFDSHPRTFGKKRISAAFYFFNSIDKMGDYIKGLFHLEQPPEDDPMTMAEEADLAILFSVAQADFFCLGSLDEEEAQQQSTLKSTIPQQHHSSSSRATRGSSGQSPLLPSADMLPGNRNQKQQRDNATKAKDNAVETCYTSGGAVRYPRMNCDGQTFTDPYVRYPRMNCNGQTFTDYHDYVTTPAQGSTCWAPHHEVVLSPIASPDASSATSYYKDGLDTSVEPTLARRRSLSKGKAASGGSCSVNDKPDYHGASSSSHPPSASTSLAVAKLQQQDLEDSLRKVQEENRRLAQDLEREKQVMRESLIHWCSSLHSVPLFGHWYCLGF